VVTVDIMKINVTGALQHWHFLISLILIILLIQTKNLISENLREEYNLFLDSSGFVSGPLEIL